jgi:chorismate mutase/prephenate dehydratase
VWVRSTGSLRSSYKTFKRDILFVFIKKFDRRAMTDTFNSPDLLSLASLRQKIDVLDDALLRLLEERTRLITHVADLKKKDNTVIYMRPAREASIVRRLLSSADAILPPDMVFRLWRELMMASLQIESAFCVAVYAPPLQPDLVMLAREHFGGATPLLFFDNTAAVVRSVSEGTALLGVVPDWHEDSNERPWWRQILGGEQASLGFVFKLPFLARANGTKKAYVVGRGVPREETGNDHSFFILRTHKEISRTSLRQQLSNAGLEVLNLFPWSDPAFGDDTYYLILLNGFFTEGDARLAPLQKNFNVRLAGGYAVPVEPVGVVDAEFTPV